MMRFIAAIDEKLGLANDEGIPWDLPTDREFFRDQTKNGIILMGMNTYRELDKPMHGRTNYVATSSDEALGPGFVAVHDAAKFIKEHHGEIINNIGGAGLFTRTLDQADELVITQIQADFHCTKFFPEFSHDFELVKQSEPITENDVAYTFQTWHRT